MDNRILISVMLSVGVFMFTVILFVVAIINVNMTSYEFGCATVTPDVPLSQVVDHPGKNVFKANCAPCHRMHQKLIGPALAGVLDRRDSVWIIKMIRNSSLLISTGDPTATQLFREYNSIQMTSFPSLSDEQLTQLLEYIKIETAQEEKPVVPRVEV